MHVCEIWGTPDKELRPRGLQGPDMAGGAAGTLGLPGESPNPRQGAAGSQWEAHHIPAAKHCSGSLMLTGAESVALRGLERHTVAPLYPLPPPGGSGEPRSDAAGAT